MVFYLARGTIHGVNRELSSLSVAAQRLLSDATPLPMRLLAAKGVAPGVSIDELFYILFALAEQSDVQLKERAIRTLNELNPALRNGLNESLSADVIVGLSSLHAKDAEIVEQLLRMPDISEEALELLAAGADERCGELVATNEALLLEHSRAIEKLYMNPAVRMSTSDRIIELAARNGLELDFPAFKLAAEAIQTQLVCEATEEPTYDDLHFRETAETAEQVDVDPALEDVCEQDEDGEEKVVEKLVPLFARLQNASVTEKIRRAMLGNATERLILVRDTNRLVAEAAAKSPRMTENEARQIAASRAVSEEVLRIIASNRDLVRAYQVKLNLVQNPRTPFTFVSRLLPHLRLPDLRALTRSKNIPGAVNKAARQTLSRRSK